MSRKIAPTLVEMVALCSKLEIPDSIESAKARAELRALLAVARAARRVAQDWDRWDEATPETCRAFHRALARLDKASATPRGDR